MLIERVECIEVFRKREHFVLHYRFRRCIRYWLPFLSGIPQHYLLKKNVASNTLKLLELLKMLLENR